MKIEEEEEEEEEVVVVVFTRENRGVSAQHATRATSTRLSQRRRWWWSFLVKIEGNPLNTQHAHHRPRGGGGATEVVVFESRGIEGDPLKG